MLGFRAARAVGRAARGRGAGMMHQHRRSALAVHAFAQFEPIMPAVPLSPMASLSGGCADGSGAEGTLPFLALAPRAPQAR